MINLQKYKIVGLCIMMMLGMMFVSPVSAAITGTIETGQETGGDTTVDVPYKPTASPVAGTYTSTQSVTLSSLTSGATIHYTVDSSAPTCTGGAVYSSAISVSSSQTIRAIACKDDGSSSVAIFAYTIQAGTGGGPGGGSDPAPTPDPDPEDDDDDVVDTVPETTKEYKEAEEKAKSTVEGLKSDKDRLTILSERVRSILAIIDGHENEEALRELLEEMLEEIAELEGGVQEALEEAEEELKELERKRTLSEQRDKMDEYKRRINSVLDAIADDEDKDNVRDALKALLEEIDDIKERIDEEL